MKFWWRCSCNAFYCVSTGTFLFHLLVVRGRCKSGPFSASTCCVLLGMWNVTCSCIHVNFEHFFFLRVFLFFFWLKVCAEWSLYHIIVLLLFCFVWSIWNNMLFQFSIMLIVINFCFLNIWFVMNSTFTFVNCVLKCYVDS